MPPAFRLSRSSSSRRTSAASPSFCRSRPAFRIPRPTRLRRPRSGRRSRSPCTRPRSRRARSSRLRRAGRRDGPSSPCSRKRGRAGRCCIPKPARRPFRAFRDRGRRECIYPPAPRAGSRFSEDRIRGCRVRRRQVLSFPKKVSFQNAAGPRRGDGPPAPGLLRFRSGNSWGSSRM